MAVFLATWGLLAGLLAGGIAVARLVPQVPYNVRELLEGGPLLVVTAEYWLLCLLLFAAPAASAGLVQAAGGGRRRWLFWPLAGAAGTVASAALLLAIAPTESLHDIVGSPILGWPGQREVGLRLIALLLTPVALWSAAALIPACAARPETFRRGDLLAFSAWTLIALALARWGVVTQAATDNLVELMARGADLLSSASLAAWILTLGFAVSWIASRSSESRRRLLAAAFLAAVASAAIGYGFLLLGTEARVHKYGQTFSALQFLLSRDRSAMVAGEAIFLRYLLVHALVLTIGVLCQIPIARGRLLLIKSPRSGTEANSGPAPLNPPPQSAGGRGRHAPEPEQAAPLPKGHEGSNR